MSFKLLILLDDDFEGVTKPYWEGVCESLCAQLAIPQWIGATNIRQLQEHYKQLKKQSPAEDILIIADVVDAREHVRFDREILKEALQKGWAGASTILFFSSEKPQYLPTKTYWVRSKTGYLEKDCQTILKTVKDERKADEVGRFDWHKVAEQMNTPWRYEYFLEVSQRMLMLDSDENIAVLKKIIFGISPPEAQYQEICEYFQPYEQVCGYFNATEQQQFTLLKQKMAEFLKPPYPGQHFWGDEPRYQEKYRAIYDLFWMLAEKEILAYDQ